MVQTRVLIVDDELLIRDLLYDFFTSRDLDVTTCNDSHDALQLLEETPGFDVVLGLKDLTLACRAAEQVGVTVALGGKARDIFQRAVDEGYSGQDTSVLTDFWAKANSLRPVRLPD